MKRVLTVLAVVLVAAVWITASWFFFNSIAAGAEESNAPAVADLNNGNPADKHGENLKGHDGHKGLWKELNLTDEQRKQVRPIVKEERAKMKPLVQRLKAGRDQLNALRKSGPFDETKVRSIAKGQADTLTELILQRERMKSRIYELLTPEQRAKAEQLQKSSKAGHEKETEKKD